MQKRTTNSVSVLAHTKHKDLLDYPQTTLNQKAVIRTSQNISGMIKIKAKDQKPICDQDKYIDNGIQMLKEEQALLIDQHLKSQDSLSQRS